VAELDEAYAEHLKTHRSRGVTAEQLKQADIIAVMSGSHAAAVIARGADPVKVHVLAAEGGGIADPYGGSIAAYRLTRDQLERAVSALADIV
jgi:protein-tyrosine phosphatase/ribose 5-phosphate isomerase B